MTIKNRTQLNAELPDNTSGEIVPADIRDIVNSALIQNDINDMTGGTITNLSDPTNAQDAATKNYVDTHSGSTPTLQQVTTAGFSWGTLSNYLNSDGSIGKGAAQSNFGMAIGEGTTANGNWSTAVGYGSTASGGYSAAFGLTSTTAGYGATASGYNSTASNNYSTALGYHASSSNNYSTAIGYNTTTNADHQVVLGTSAETVVIPGKLSSDAGAITTDGSGTFTTPINVNTSSYVPGSIDSIFQLNTSQVTGTLRFTGQQYAKLEFCAATAPTDEKNWQFYAAVDGSFNLTSITDDLTDTPFTAFSIQPTAFMSGPQFQMQIPVAMDGGTITTDGSGYLQALSASIGANINLNNDGSSQFGGAAPTSQVKIDTSGNLTALTVNTYNTSSGNPATHFSTADDTDPSAVSAWDGRHTVFGQSGGSGGGVGFSNTASTNTENILFLAPGVVWQNAQIYGQTFQFYTEAPSELLAMKLDSGLFFPRQASSAPSYVKGAIYFDTTLNKLRVGGATGWETITSV